MHINGLTDVRGLVFYNAFNFFNSFLLLYISVSIFFLLFLLLFHCHFFSQNGLVQPTAPDVAVRPLPQVVEMTGSESPSTISWNSRNPRVRHDLSRARLRAIECSLENGQLWVPPSPLHRKTWEEEVNLLMYLLLSSDLRFLLQLI